MKTGLPVFDRQPSGRPRSERAGSARRRSCYCARVSKTQELELQSPSPPAVRPSVGLPRMKLGKYVLFGSTWHSPTVLASDGVTLYAMVVVAFVPFQLRQPRHVFGSAVTGLGYDAA